MNPTITALEMKRTRPPARRRPANSMIAPVSTASMSMPATRRSGGRTAKALPAARLSAAVGTMDMRSELEVSAPDGAPAMTPYSPWTGGMPASMVYAIELPI